LLHDPRWATTSARVTHLGEGSAPHSHRNTRRAEMSWNASCELVSRISASIRPIETGVSLHQALAEDFPRDCADLPISGGWGYTQATAILFVLNQFSSPGHARDFVSIEYHVAQKSIYEELIIFRPQNYRFSGITADRKLQNTIHSVERIYDK